MTLRARSLVMTLVLLVGCDAGQNPVFEPAPLDEAFFDCEVQPLLDRECAFPACHGDSARPFALLAPGRMRMSVEYGLARLTTSAEDLDAGVHPALTAVERRHNLNQAMAFVPPDGDRRASQLLTRPLAVGAGGIYHAPAGDVFTTTADPAYQTILAWLGGATATRRCL